MLKIIKFIGLGSAAVTAIVLIGWLSAKFILIKQAEGKAHAIVQDALQESPDIIGNKEIIAITTRVSEIFHHQDPATIPILRLRRYITNHRLPDLIRLPDGVIETLIEKGYCANAARMLSFILKQKNIDSVQWNMVYMNQGHSALLVTTADNKKMMVDPFYGYITTSSSGEPIHPKNAQERLKQGEKFESIFLQLNSKNNPVFYKDFENASMAAAGDNLILESTLPRLNKIPLILGQLDGDDLDVKAAGATNNLTPYWHYAGHRYNREWIRVLKFTEPVQVVMTLLSPAEKGIMTATPAPIVIGNQMAWNLKPGDKLTFTDDQAKLSLKRLNSYIGIDQIAFYPAH